jgi:hypothetical protein
MNTQQKSICFTKMILIASAFWLYVLSAGQARAGGLLPVISCFARTNLWFRYGLEPNADELPIDDFVIILDEAGS